MSGSLRRKLVLSLAFAALVYLSLGLYADGPRLLSAFAQWDWRWLPLALAATVTNYFLRFLRWHYYLRVLGVANLSPHTSGLIFLSGFALTMTPGKLGEVLKSWLLKTRSGTPISYSAPAVFAERLTDVIGMGLLASLGLATFASGPATLAALGIGLVAGILLLQQRRLAVWMLDRLESLPVVGRAGKYARNLYESASLLLRLQPLALAILLATSAWFAECVALLCILLGFGLSFTPALLVNATFVYAGASLFGAATLLPGGLGATEGSMALLLEQIVALAREQAVAAVFIVRLVTLWFAVLLGAASLVALREDPGAVAGAAAHTKGD